MADYAGLTKQLLKTIEGDKGIPGRLGYQVGGVWRVVDENDPSKFYVRFQNGTFVSAYHRNRVLQKPDAPVRVGVNSFNQPVILGVDEDLIDMFTSSGVGGGSAGITVGPHDHVRNSGREFIIDTWMLKQLRASAVTGTTEIKVASGYYLYNGQLRYWEEDTIDLAGDLPTGSLQRWVVVVIDPETETLMTFPGASSYGDQPMDPAAVLDISEIPQDYILIAAVWVNGGATQIYNYQIEDLRFMNRNSSSSVVSVSGLVYGDPLSSTEIEEAFGVRETGFIGVMDDGGSGERVFGVVRSINSWQMWEMLGEALSMLEFISPSSGGSYTPDTTPTFTWAEA